MAFELKDKYNVCDLKALVAVLRGEGGCPWDIEQTHESIRRNFLEEAYEVAEAIDEGSPEHLKEELGDVLLQVIFHAGIEEDAGRFTLDDAADAECRKMIFRHPHIFGSERFETSDEVLDMWEDVKKIEKKYDSDTAVLRSVAKSLPGTWRAEKVQSKAEKAGYEHSGLDETAEKIKNAAEAIKRGCDKSGQAKAVSQMLFEAVNAARMLGIDPEEALSFACEDFIDKFEEAEKDGKIKKD